MLKLRPRNRTLSQRPDEGTSDDPGAPIRGTPKLQQPPYLATSQCLTRSSPSQIQEISSGESLALRRPDLCAAACAGAANGGEVHLGRSSLPEKATGPMDSHFSGNRFWMHANHTEECTLAKAFKSRRQAEDAARTAAGGRHSARNVHRS